MDLQNNVTFQNLACQVLNKKMIDLRKWSVKSCQLFYLLGKPSHERHKFGKGLILKFGNPKRFQDLESQVLNSAIIVKNWNHGIMELQKCNISKLGMPSLEQKC